MLIVGVLDPYPSRPRRPPDVYRRHTGLPKRNNETGSLDWRMHFEGIGKASILALFIPGVTGG
ncbi:hypothetical protein P872_22000 [Rhodonellum psychrophilum GCM71 = DSM 17998]|uniref:Uncharacterized protein n=1 Tax=Rhodonellum psychrophilum GCM71 = DSM 17998 TaxID=1123057 RepID=U5BSB8_9BACT|nr:hypothetical protein P872_22000 [Rhodonellum psychrophilum GCM71 = DSM 17998]